MTDLSATIVPKSDQLNADDLITGPRTVTITGVKVATGEQPVSIAFDGDNGKPWKPGKSMRRALVHLWGANGQSYVGKQVTLFCEPTVKWGGKQVGGIRISHASGLDKPLTFALTESRGSRVAYTIQPLENFDNELSALESAPDLAALKTAWLSISPAAQKALKISLENIKNKLQ